MNVYLDSGVFIDYLLGQSPQVTSLRSTERRGRAPERLLVDAQACLSAILARHAGMTSSLTCYEVEEAVYAELRRSSKGLVNADQYIVPSAREVIDQILVTIGFFKIRMVALTPAIVTAQCANLELRKRGIRAADALHITTALIDADIFVSTDRDLIVLDNIFAGRSGLRLRCVDTDQALSLLT